MQTYAHKSNLSASGIGRSHERLGLERQRGVGMIEVLISIIIASFALLGLAGLQVASLRYQKTAHFRTLASQYGADIADRIRANTAGANAGNYVTGAALHSTGPGNAPASNCVTAKCSAEQVAALDIYRWRANLANGMPGGWGEITGNVANGFVATVYFREPDKIDGILDPNCRAAALVAADTDVRCFTMEFVP